MQVLRAAVEITHFWDDFSIVIPTICN